MKRGPVHFLFDDLPAPTPCGINWSPGDRHRLSIFGNRVTCLKCRIAIGRPPRKTKRQSRAA